MIIIHDVNNLPRLALQALDHAAVVMPVVVVTGAHRRSCSRLNVSSIGGDVRDNSS